jgi:endo-1,4-beta-D-glucanase Y
MRRSILAAALLLLSSNPLLSAPAAVHVWELQEIELRASGAYANPYADVECWIELVGPGFAKRVYGFWDGGSVYRVRVVATVAGPWRWSSGSNQPGDAGLNGKSGSFVAAEWSEEEKRQNPNRRGFLRAAPGGHALQYDDGTPFFLLGDTWLGAATWRLPLTEAPADPNYRADPGVTFQQAVALRKRQGFNSVSVIAAFPTWDTDQYPATYADRRGVYYRNAWEEFGVTVPGNKPTAKSMHDERGNRPFEMVPGSEGLADYDRVVPPFFQSLDRKIRLLSDQGLVPMLETIRRDVAPPWKAYFDFDKSYGRFLQYIVARYGAFNLILSKIHFDIYLPNYSLTADEFNAAITGHFRQYGPMPFGQPVTSLIDRATDTTFGTGEKAPWLTMHSTGNKPRDHGIYADMERQFRLVPPMPTSDLEPHYTGWVHGNNVVHGEQAESGSARDNYFSRAQMFGCVLSGGLAGHVHGTGAYDVTSASEPAGPRPYFWQALAYASAEYMRGLGAFVLSEGTRYRELQLASEDLTPRKAPGSFEDGLEGWSFLMRTPDKGFGLLYFENKAIVGRAAGWRPGGRYTFAWFDPRTGTWLPATTLQADKTGTLQLPPLPAAPAASGTDGDWAAKIVEAMPAPQQAAPRPAGPAPAPGGAFATRVHRNLFREAGRSDADIRKKIDTAFEQLFHGDADTQTVYYWSGSNANGRLAYLSDINNRDVRSEGMSYGMMIAVQMDKKAEFDALWNWSRTFMFHDDPAHPAYGFFSWSMKTDGTPNSESPAPDGEEYMAMALYFASARWGDGKGIYDYRAMADRLLSDMKNRGVITGPWVSRKDRIETDGAEFNLEHRMVRFTPDNNRPDHTDPSYHLPAFYELWARWGPVADRPYWAEAARVSRDFLQVTTNRVTGLAPEYANFDGTPVTSASNRSAATFGPDAWRTAANWAVDWAWWAADPRQRQLSDRIQTFFDSKGLATYGNRWALDGSVELGKDHSTALVATNAVASLAATDRRRAAQFVDALWNAEIPSGRYRYYDGMWYLMGLLHCSGQYRIWTPKWAAAAPPPVTGPRRSPRDRGPTAR